MTRKDGKPCKRCGTNEWSKWGGCYECKRRASVEYRKKYPEKVADAKKASEAKKPKEYKKARKKYYEENKTAILETHREWYHRNFDKVKRDNTKWRKNNPGIITRMTRRYRQKYPHKYKAHNAVNSAVARGELPHASTRVCSADGCNKQAQEYHHHKGYSENSQLDVIPVCAKCHRALDKKRRATSPR